eukprot:scaffold2678_cov105-Pinguiococcus_pyrenoidosus.AAC.1
MAKELLASDLLASATGSWTRIAAGCCGLGRLSELATSVAVAHILGRPLSSLASFGSSKTPLRSRSSSGT